MAEERSDVFSGAGVGERPGGRAVNMLWFLEDTGSKAIKDAAAGMESVGGEDVEECFSGLWRKGWDGGVQR